MRHLYKIKYNIFIILVTIFTILKLNRNTASSFEGTTQGGIWNIVPLIIIFYSIIIVISYLLSGKKFPLTIKITIFFTLFSMLNSLFYLHNFNILTFYTFVMIGCYSSIIIVFYDLCNTKLSEKQINLTLICVFLISFFSFLSIFKIMTEGLLLYISNLYFSLSIFPLFLFFSKNKLLNIIILMIITLTLLFSTKRTGLIAYTVFMLLYNFILSLQNGSIVRFIKALFVILICIFIFYFVYNSISSTYDVDLLGRMDTLTKDGGSGRDEIYSNVWNGFKNSTFENKILGHGIFSIEVDFGHGHAHNDFLDILYRFGIIPFLLIIFFYISLFYEGFIMFKYKYDKTHIYIASLFISLTLTMFSVYIVGLEYIVTGMTFVGISLGQWELYKNNIKEKLV